MEEATQPVELKAAEVDRPPASDGAVAQTIARRGSELALVVAFLVVIATVPIAQTLMELARHERVQFTDVFRYRPTAKNLRQYEATLKEKSWFQQKLRPEVQRLLFATVRDTGAKGVLGRDRWLFYRSDLRYLVEPDRPETDRADSKWVASGDGSTQRGNVVRAIVRFRDQLKERGIALLVMPVPGKPSVYPDEVTRREAGRGVAFRSPTLEIIQSLEKQGVAVVDLFAVFSPRGSWRLQKVRSTWHRTRIGHRWARVSPQKRWPPDCVKWGWHRSRRRRFAPNACRSTVGEMCWR